MLGLSVTRLESNVFFGTQEPDVIDTRFGRVALKRENPIVFPRGLLGMPDKFNFFITEFPNEKFARFKLLQSLDDYELSFITQPIDLENAIISVDDLALACKDVSIALESLVTLLIVTVHRSPEKVVISVNARAPVLIDVASHLAVQYVFASDKYHVQHVISA